MAMEVKMLEVKNSEEESTVQFWSKFGWQLKSSQRIFNKDSHLERRGDDVYSVTETIDFTKLVLERDKSNPNYSQIVALESEYLSTLSALPSSKPTAGAAYDTMEEWAKNTNPDMRTGGQKGLFFILLIGGIALFALLESFSTIFTMALQGVGIVMIILSFITKGFLKKSMLKKALSGEYPEGVAKLNEGFRAYEHTHSTELAAIRNYERDVDRLVEIEEELETLI